MLKSGLKQWYVDFLAGDDKNIAAVLFRALLIFLSGIYGAVVGIRNFAYDKKITPIFYSTKKIISVGNLSWGGTGKTTLTLYLYQKLSARYKIAILRRGYGDDENKLIEQSGAIVYADKNRAALAGKLSEKYGVFILDDGFQYRKLARQCDIVVMGARELKLPRRLIPAQIFREPLSSLKRANILVINHAEQAAGLNEFKSETKKKSPHLKIFTSGYKIKKFCDLRDNIVNSGDFSGRPTAALTAIGYPDGFFQMLSKEGVKVAKKITYPDHYELSEKEFEKIQNELADEGINDIIITRKDKYHLPGLPPGKIRVIVMDIEMIIEDSENFLREVENCLIK